MRITKRQLRRIIREAEGSTNKYDTDSALRGGQSTLPDVLQRGIIDKTVEDREDREEEDHEEKNESVRITKRQLRRIIKEEWAKILNEALPHFQKNARAAGASYSSQRAPSPVSKKVGDLDVVPGAFKGTSTDRARLKKELTSQVEKIKAAGKENTLPANVGMILSRSDGDQLAALQKHINPGMFKKLGKLFGLGENTERVTEKQLRRIVKEELKTLETLGN